MGGAGLGASIGIGSNSGQPDTIIVEGEQQCEVIRPGVVVSPYDKQRAEIMVAPRQWAPSGRLRCPATHRFFRLPKKLDPLVAEVISPGVIHSPFADPGQNMKVAWENWVPGTEVLCADTGKKIVLPADLPLPPGSIPPLTFGKVISPYVAGMQFDVSPELWEPGTEVICPVTGLPFVMPGNLPPFEALADVSQPGVLASPFAPGVSWEIPPSDWVSGGRIVCPKTHRELVRPAIVEQWVPEARVANAARRMVYNPFQPGATVQIPASDWQPGNAVRPSEVGRALLLPRDLPPLLAEIIDGRVDAVRSPYTGEVLQVTLKEWVPGGRIKCSKTGAMIVLPDSLPERIPTGDIAPSKAGYAISPYEPHSEFRVTPEEWSGGGLVVCPVSGRRFRLPSSLPLLEAIIKPGRLGVLASPFAPSSEFKIPIDEWLPGQRRDCPITHKPFVLPEKLEEWIVDGEWVPMQPGYLRSPFLTRPVVAVPVESWQAGALLTCSVARRRFRVPNDVVLPSMPLEKEAVEFALAQPPETSETDAAKTLNERFPEATAKLVKSIWARHDLAAVEKRRRAQATRGGSLPNEPGYVLSPYGSKHRVEVPPDKWVEPGAAVRCPETGRRFLLPENLPHLFAILDPAKPGSVISPFQSDKPFEVPPAEWEPNRVLKCAHTGYPLRLPARLPVWRPVGTVPDSDDGVVLSPFATGTRISVDGKSWKPGHIVTCTATRKEFVLPEMLPPLRAKNVRPGLAESPYAPGELFEVNADQWKPRGLILCPQTKRLFKLPDSLPEKEWPATVVRPGVVQSPYGSHLEIDIPGPDWAAGTSHLCPETGRRFALPDNLPPLQALVVKGVVGEVHSPYVPAERTAGVITVSLRDWEPGFRIVCPATSRICVLPEHLPLWEGEALLVPGQPGMVESPYRHKQKIKVPASQWNPGEQLVCEESGRRFCLPDELPMLEGRVADAARGLVISPHDESAAAQLIPDDQWLPENTVTCQKTGKPFRLPKDLGVLALEASVVLGKPGVIRSPYGKKQEVTVPGPDWLTGARVTCPETGKTFIMPAGLAPLTADLVPGKPGRVVSPYSGVATEMRVPWRRWQPGATINCRATKRPFVLPKDLPKWDKPPLHWSITAAAILLVAALISGAAWYGLKLHRDEVLRNDIATKGKIQTLETQLGSTFDRPVAEQYCALVAQILPRVTDAAEKETLSAALASMRKRIDDAKVGDVINDLEQQVGNLEAQLASKFDVNIARGYCEMLSKAVPGVADSARRADFAGRYADMRLRILKTETGEDMSASKAGDQAHTYFAAIAQGAAAQTEREQALMALRQSNSRTDLVVVASEALTERGLPAAYDEFFKAAAAGVTWAQEHLKEKFTVAIDDTKPLTVKIPEGLPGSGSFTLSKADWKPGPYEYKEGGKASRWFRLPDKLGAAPPSKFVLAGGLQIEGIEKAPAELVVTVGGKTVGEKNLRAGEQASFGPVPDELQGKSQCELEFRLPGWMPARVKLTATRDGDFSVPEPIKMVRERWSLPLSIPSDMDYDYIHAEWTGPLPEQPLAVSIGPEDKQFKNSAKAGEYRITIPTSSYVARRAVLPSVPSGIYRLTLTSAKSERVLDYPWPDPVFASEEGVNQLVAMPPSMAGKYYGLMTTIKNGDQDICIFATLEVGKRIESINFAQAPAIISNLSGLFYTYSSVEGQAVKHLRFTLKDAELQTPTRLRFQCPFDFGWVNWSFETGGAAGAVPQMRHQAVQASTDSEFETLRIKRVALHNSSRGVSPASKTGIPKLDLADEFKSAYQEFLKSDSLLIKRESEESIDLHLFLMYPGNTTLKPWRHPVGTSSKMEWDVQPSIK